MIKPYARPPCNMSHYGTHACARARTYARTHVHTERSSDRQEINNHVLHTHTHARARGHTDYVCEPSLCLLAPSHFNGKKGQKRASHRTVPRPCRATVPGPCLGSPPRSRFCFAKSSYMHSRKMNRGIINCLCTTSTQIL